MAADAYIDELERHGAVGEQMSFDHLTAPDKPAPSPPTRPARKSPPADEPRTPLVTGRHQDVRLYLTLLLKTFVEMTDTGLVRDAPFGLQTESGLRIDPDVIFVANASLDRVHESYVEGPPDIVVEVCSKASTAADRGDKFVAYETIGVREYWLVDPVRQLVNMFHLGPDGCYDEFRPDTAGRLRSRVLTGLVLDMDPLWRRVLPTTAEVLDAVQKMVDKS
jgi:Uma2 family endonuclease